MIIRSFILEATSFDLENYILKPEYTYDFDVLLQNVRETQYGEAQVLRQVWGPNPVYSLNAGLTFYANYLFLNIPDIQDLVPARGLIFKHQDQIRAGFLLESELVMLTKAEDLETFDLREIMEYDYIQIMPEIQENGEFVGRFSSINDAYLQLMHIQGLPQNGQTSLDKFFPAGKRGYVLEKNVPFYLSNTITSENILLFPFTKTITLVQNKAAVKFPVDLKLVEVTDHGFPVKFNDNSWCQQEVVVKNSLKGMLTPEYENISVFMLPRSKLNQEDPVSGLNEISSLVLRYMIILAIYAEFFPFLFKTLEIQKNQSQVQITVGDYFSFKLEEKTQNIISNRDSFDAVQFFQEAGTNDPAVLEVLKKIPEGERVNFEAVEYLDALEFLIATKESLGQDVEALRWLDEKVYQEMNDLTKTYSQFPLSKYEVGEERQTKWDFELARELLDKLDQLYTASLKDYTPGADEQKELADFWRLVDGLLESDDKNFLGIAKVLDALRPSVANIQKLQSIVKYMYSNPVAEKNLTRIRQDLADVGTREAPERSGLSVGHVKESTNVGMQGKKEIFKEQVVQRFMSSLPSGPATEDDVRMAKMYFENQDVIDLKITGLMLETIVTLVKERPSKTEVAWINLVPNDYHEFDLRTIAARTKFEENLYLSQESEEEEEEQELLIDRYDDYLKAEIEYLWNRLRNRIVVQRRCGILSEALEASEILKEMVNIPTSLLEYDRIEAVTRTLKRVGDTLSFYEWKRLSNYPLDVERIWEIIEQVRYLEQNPGVDIQKWSKIKAMFEADANGYMKFQSAYLEMAESCRVNGTSICDEYNLAQKRLKNNRDSPFFSPRMVDLDANCIDLETAGYKLTADREYLRKWTPTGMMEPEEGTKKRRRRVVESYPTSPWYCFNCANFKKMLTGRDNEIIRAYTYLFEFLLEIEKLLLEPAKPSGKVKRKSPTELNDYLEFMENLMLEVEMTPPELVNESYPIILMANLFSSVLHRFRNTKIEEEIVDEISPGRKKRKRSESKTEVGEPLGESKTEVREPLGESKTEVSEPLKESKTEVSEPLELLRNTKGKKKEVAEPWSSKIDTSMLATYLLNWVGDQQYIFKKEDLIKRMQQHYPQVNLERPINEILSGNYANIDNSDLTFDVIGEYMLHPFFFMSNLEFISSQGDSPINRLKQLNPGAFQQAIMLLKSPKYEKIKRLSLTPKIMLQQRFQEKVQDLYRKLEQS